MAVKDMKFMKEGVRLLPVEWVAVVYGVLTCVLMVIMWPRLVDPAGMLILRAEWLTLTVSLLALSRLRFFATKKKLTDFLRVLAQMGWLSQWYPDTYEFNRSFNNLDHVFAAAEQSLFGCQPAIEFSQALPGAVWSEAFNLGYWSYFPMIGVLVIAVFWMERQKKILQDFHWLAATIMTSFFLYYAIYIFLPVTGPQFYFQAVGIQEIAAGHFPPLGTYFSQHTEMLPAPGYADGIFYQFVHASQAAGERPTAAFPSSHIGISTIVLLLSRRHAPRVTPFLLPFWMLLCCATVYIQAHYLIDAIAGLASVPVVLWMATRLNRGWRACAPSGQG